MSINVLSPDQAKDDARQLLAKAKAKYGFVPNLLGVMAHAPATLEAYMTLSGLFDQTSLSPTERQVVLLAISAEHECTYCVAAHTAIAKMQDADADAIEAIRNGEPIADDKLQALRRFAVDVATTRGWPSDETKRAFHDAGYSEAHALEVILGVGMKTLSNYTNHMAQTPLDDAFADAAWEPGSASQLGCPRLAGDPQDRAPATRQERDL